jgi:hypothetical protein
MPQIPEITWKRLSADEFKQIKGSKRKLDYVDKALINLAKEDKITIWQRPDGKIMFQLNGSTI